MRIEDKGTDPLFMKQGSEYYFYHNDHLGTPQKMTAVNGAVVWSAKYTSFGKAYVDPASTVENNLRFGGQYEDAETGLHYNFWRYYSPETGRYLAPDPIGLAGGINPFVYADNNTVNAIDPMGLQPSIWNVPSFSNDVQGILNTVESAINKLTNIVTPKIPKPVEGIGAGFYAGFGVEGNYSNFTYCENGIKYKIEIVTACGGLGAGLKGALPINAKIRGISSRPGAPKTRYYLKREIVAFVRSVNAQLEFDPVLPSAGIDVGIYGASTTWVFCSDTIISKQKIGCCSE